MGSFEIEELDTDQYDEVDGDHDGAGDADDAGPELKGPDIKLHQLYRSQVHYYRRYIAEEIDDLLENF